METLLGTFLPVIFSKKARALSVCNRFSLATVRHALYLCASRCRRPTQPIPIEDWEIKRKEVERNIQSSRSCCGCQRVWHHARRRTCARQTRALCRRSPCLRCRWLPGWCSFWGWVWVNVDMCDGVACVCRDGVSKSKCGENAREGRVVTQTNDGVRCDRDAMR